MNFETIFHSSYQHNVIDQSNLFFTRFYQKFISSSPQVREAFKNTDMNRQKDMLKDSLNHIIDFASTKTSNTKSDRQNPLSIRNSLTNDSSLNL